MGAKALLLFLFGCSGVTVFDDCRDDYTGEFDINDCHAFPEACEDIEKFCTPHLNKDKCVKQVTKKCEEIDYIQK